MSQEQNFRMFAGDAKTLIFNVVDENNATVDISNHTVRWRVANDVAGTLLLSKSTTASQITTTGSTAGEFRVTLGSTDSNTLEGVYYHEAELESPTANRFTVVFGHGTFVKGLIV